jgi:poly(3-hydroxybutyrate) depolymerase
VKHVLLAVVLLLAIAAVALGHAAPSPAPGAVVHGVACTGDPSQTYSLYLPSSYTVDRKWPVLFVFDPRGRGATALEVFRDAAEELGWIVVSSDNTASDGPVEPNRRAVTAMWNDVPGRYAVDPKRVYLAGFSGTVSVAWLVAVSTRQVAGVVGVGGQMTGYAFGKNPLVPLFAAAGQDDFNWIETRDIVKAVGDAGGVVRFEAFAGEHQWCPPVHARLALAWFELQAMKAGVREPDRAWIARELRGESERLEAMEVGGDLVGARRGLETAIASFEGLAEVEGLRARLKALLSRRELAAAARDERRWDDWEQEQCRSATVTLQGILNADERVTPREAAAQLHIAPLRKQAGEGGGYRAHAAQRVLSWLFVQTSYYVWRDELGKKAFPRAILLQQIAELVFPDSPIPDARLALTLARAGDADGALEALARAARRGWSSVESLERESSFDRLRGSAEYRAIVERVRKNAEAAAPRQ